LAKVLEPIFTSLPVAGNQERTKRLFFPANTLEPRGRTPRAAGAENREFSRRSPREGRSWRKRGGSPWRPCRWPKNRLPRGRPVSRNWIRFQERERDRAGLLLEKSRLEAGLRDAELQVLRMRLNPHFLFNTLQNISVLAQDEPKLASQMLVRLGDLLRSALGSEGHQEVPLSAEIALTESYLALEKMRFGDRLKVSIELAPETSEAMVPTLLLQPLVENAIRHGLGKVAKNGVIRIRSEIEGRRLKLSVRDNGLGTPGPLEDLELGIGLASTRDRLSRMYKDDGELAVSRHPDGGTEARVVLPLRPATGYEQTAAAHRG
jgi:two-component system LytT family sensor kinase